MDELVRLVVWGYFLLFAFAFFGKLDGWRGWTALTADLPYPRAARQFVRGAVPFSEAAVAVALAIDFSVGLALAGLLMGLLALGVASLMPSLRGRECNCFGAALPAAIGYRLVLRNGALVVVAFAAWGAAASQERHQFGLTE